ncbi:MAG: HD domain-containing protein [Kiritimatiellae bacterium]|nr:HD domain-containing protein [Kiritimatiellia bacterium]
MADRLQLLRDRYREYVDTFRTEDGKLPPMMQLKLTHTAGVVHAARLIAKGENFDARTSVASEAAALLHDTGRYEQLKRYNTFKDSDSVDHAVFSHDIVREKGWLDGWEDKEAILLAVLVHNRREIPAGMDALSLACSRTVRDADKLDIFRVLEDQVEHCDWRNDSRAFWNLKTDAPPNPAVCEAIRNSRPVDYGSITCLADFVLIQVGWMISGLEYATSRGICADRGHLEFRRRFLHGLTDSPAVDELCDFAARVLAE